LQQSETDISNLHDFCSDAVSKAVTAARSPDRERANALLDLVALTEGNGQSHSLLGKSAITSGLVQRLCGRQSSERALRRGARVLLVRAPSVDVAQQQQQQQQSTWTHCVALAKILINPIFPSVACRTF